MLTRITAVLLLASSAGASRADDFTWLGGFHQSDWTNTSLWSGTASAYPDSYADTALIDFSGLSNPILDADVQVGQVTIRGGRTLSTGGFQYSVFTSGGYSGDTIIEDTGSLLTFYDDPNNLTDGGTGLIINAGGTARLDTAAPVVVSLRKLAIADGGLFEGAGTLNQLGRTGFVTNNGTIRVTGGTLTCNPWDANSLFDMDGDLGYGRIEIDDDCTLDIQMNVETAFDGELVMGENSTLNVSVPWTVGGFSTLFDVNANAGTATISGVQFGGTGPINVNSGTLVIDAPSDFPGIAEINLAAGTTLWVNAPATFGGSGLSLASATLLINADTTIGDGTDAFDWDGTGTATTIVSQASTLTIDAIVLDGIFDTFDGTLIIDDGSVVDVSCSDGEWELAGTLRFTTPFLQTGYPRLKGDTLRVTNGTISVEDLGTAATIHCDLILGPGSLLTVQDEAQFNVGGTNLTLAGGSIVSTNSTSIPELESNILVTAASTIDAVGATSFWGPHVDIQAPLTIHADRFTNSVFGPDLTIGPAGVLDFDYNDQLYVAQRMMGSVDLTGTTSGAVLMTGDRLELAGTTTIDKHVIIESPLDITGVISIGASDTLTLRGGTPADPTVLAGGVIGGTPTSSFVIEGAVRVESNGGITRDLQTTIVPAAEIVFVTTFGTGPVLNRGRIAFESAFPSTLQPLPVFNRFEQDFSGRLEIRVGPSGADHIDVMPDLPTDQARAILRGELYVELFDGFVPTPGTTYDIVVPQDSIFEPGQVNGLFQTVTGPPNMAVIYSGDITQITFTDPACSPADINADGALNLDDVNLFANAFIATDLLADIDDNGVLNLDDVNLFAAAFLAGCP